MSAWDPTGTPSFWINHTSRLLMRHFEKELRPFELGMAYLPVVIALDENGPMLQRDLAILAHVEQPTMAALIGRMERDGLVEREPHPTDKRAALLSLSRKGKTRLPRAKETLSAVAERATHGLSEPERAQLLGLLQRVAANLEPGTDS